MFGQSCRKGEAKITYGTCAFILLNTGEEVIQLEHGLLTTLAFNLGKDAPANYTLEDSFAIVKRMKSKMKKGQFLLRVDGWVTVNTTPMQIHADLLGSSVVRPTNIETIALGAAYAAGLVVGVWMQEEIFSNRERMKIDTNFNLVLNEELRKKKVAS